MSETQKFVGKFQLKSRLENETDKQYFERVTGCNYQRYDYEPRGIWEAIHDNDITYYEAKRGQKGYLYLENNIYEILEIQERDVCEDYCYLEKTDDNTFKFEAQFYNGVCGLEEMIKWGFKKDITND